MAPIPESVPIRRVSDNRSLNRRLDSLSRERDSVRRLLEQANLEIIRDGMGSLKKRLDSIESKLSGSSD
ncbi:MAG: hypothetical protein VYD50_00815 [Candidatus Thermoplasmatota archaeon]|nr:hypothetical protein [Candidatus Thermoplasmatota archaeon]